MIQKSHARLTGAVALAAIGLLAWAWQGRNAAPRAGARSDEAAPGRVSAASSPTATGEAGGGRRSPAERPRPKEGWLLGRFTKKDYNKNRFSTFLPDGRMSPQAMEAAALTAPEATAIQEIFDHQRRELEGIITGRMRSSHPTRADEIASYQIDAFEEKGAEIFGASVGKIDDIIGGLRREQLLSGYRLSDSYFSYGRYDTTVSILKNAATGEGLANGYSAVRVTTVNPKTGKKHREQLVPLDQFEERYGKILPLD